MLTMKNLKMQSCMMLTALIIGQTAYANPRALLPRGGHAGMITILLVGSIYLLLLFAVRSARRGYRQYREKKEQQQKPAISPKIILLFTPAVLLFGVPTAVGGLNDLLSTALFFASVVLLAGPLHLLLHMLRQADKIRRVEGLKPRMFFYMAGLLSGLLLYGLILSRIWEG